VRFFVNEEAFRYDNLTDVRKSLVAETPIPGSPDDQLDVAVRKVLYRLPVPSGALFVVSPNEIEVTTEGFLRAQNLAPEPPPPPTPNQLRRARDLRDTLIRPCQFNGFTDPKLTLGEALDFMAKRYELRFHVNYMAFKYESVTEEEVRGTLVAGSPIPRAGSLTLPGKVLEVLLPRIPVESGAVFVVRPKGHIEITTRHFLLCEMQRIDPITAEPVGAGGK